MTKLAKRIVEIGVLALALVAGACGDDDDPSVMIVSPTNDSTLTIADDADPALDGIQVAVEVSVENENDGEDVWLYTDATVLADMPDAEPMSIEPIADGAVTFVTTLEPGTHDLLACVRDCEFRSQQVRVTVVAGCGGITFIDPLPSPGDETLLGRADDVDGMACGDQFTVDVRVTTTTEDGTALQLFVNGTPGPTASAAAGQATFENVVLGNRLPTGTNTLAVQVTDASGASCRQPFPNPIAVDCDGTSCAITLPDADSTFLNASDDVSASDGFQADFEVTGGSDAVGETFELIVDGAMLSATSMASGGSAVAEFNAIDLSEGRHSVAARCFDELGNPTLTEPAIWIVDTIPCDATVTEPAADTLFIDDDDIDDTTDGIQIDVSGTVSGDACTGVTAGPCGGAGADLTLAASSFDGAATLASTPTQELCVIVTDEAGNTGETRVPVQVRTDAPQLQIATPATATVFNNTGTMGGTADLTPETDACDLAATVYCTEVGVPVEIEAAASGTLLGTADCVATAGLPSPFTGQADFASIPVPSANDGSDVDIVARQTADRLVGTSAPISITPDCDEPTLSFFSPICGSTLSPTDDDEDPGTAGFQYTVRVINPTGNNADTTELTVVDSGGGSVFNDTSSTRSGTSIVFSEANLGAGGELTFSACATDPTGNVGCTADCPVTILDLPEVAITSPADGASLNGADDCDTGTAGLQVRVTGTTDAADSATATVTFGSLAPQSVAVSGGTIDACVDAEQGAGVAVVLSVDEGGGAATAMINVDVDSAPPTDVISDLTLDSVVDRRGGIARLQYTSVADEDGSTLDETEIRCSSETIDDETEWGAAEVFALRSAASPTSVVAEDVPGFLVGVQYYCLARSSDVGGNLTPLPAGGGTSVLVDFLSHTIEDTGTVALGGSMRAVGDIDGDLITDFVIAGDSEVYIFFGRTTFGATADTPDLVIVGEGNFGGPAGGEIAGVGDFNGDGRSDFMVGAGFDDSAYVFFGRSSRADWGTGPITVSATECPAAARALCLRGTGGTFFGWSVGATGDFNGDGTPDIMVGAPGADGFKGTHYIVLGSSSFGASASTDVTDVAGFAVTSTAAPAQKFMGHTGRSMGDVSSPPDGRDDLVLGASGSGSTVQGEARLLLGRDHSGGAGLDNIEWDALTVLGTGGGGRYPANVYALGDIDGGGSPELAIQIGTSAGSVAVLTGESGFTTGWSMTNDLASSADDAFGIRSDGGLNAALGGLGQIDGASGMDVFMASNESGTGPGDARLWYAPLTGATVRSSADVVFSATATGSVSAGFVGDVNGDGHLDLAVGEPTASGGLGLVTLYY